MQLATHGDRRAIGWRGAAPFLICHFIPLLAFVTGVTTRAIVLGIVLYVTRLFFITAGYHRYFAHRTYRANRAVQFVLGFGGSLAVQKGPLWWASQHRVHHRYADTALDPHSPQKGFWWSHIGWILSGRYGRADTEIMEDFARYPELRFIDKHDWIGPWALGIASFLIAGWSGLVIGFFASTVLLWHATFAVNSVTHVLGWRRYATGDTSRNNPVVALLTFGEGWHNNHHHYPTSARQGFKWYELDVSYLILRGLSFVGVVHDLRRPPVAATKARRLREGYFDIGRYRQHLARAATTVPAHLPEIRAALDAAAERASRGVRNVQARSAEASSVVTVPSRT